MIIKYYKKELASDIQRLEVRGVEMDVAKEIAEFKRLIDCAAHTWYDLCGTVDEDKVPEDILYAFGNGNEYLEQAYWEVIGILPLE